MEKSSRKYVTSAAESFQFYTILVHIRSYMLYKDYVHTSTSFFFNAIANPLSSMQRARIFSILIR